MNEHAADVRALLERERFGVLSTNAVDHPGYPFGSVVPFALSAAGEVIFIASQLAEHTKNFSVDPKASLFVRDTSRPTADPQTLPRVTLLGTVAPEDQAEAQEIFLLKHPKGSAYLEMQDFALYRLKVEGARYVGGFGKMSWLNELAMKG